MATDDLERLDELITRGSAIDFDDAIHAVASQRTVPTLRGGTPRKVTNTSQTWRESWLTWRNECSSLVREMVGAGHPDCVTLHLCMARHPLTMDPQHFAELRDEIVAVLRGVRCVQERRQANRQEATGPAREDALDANRERKLLVTIGRLTALLHKRQVSTDEKVSVRAIWRSWEQWSVSAELASEPLGERQFREIVSEGLAAVGLKDATLPSTEDATCPTCGRALDGRRER